ncbi:MAG: murein biosynthesis integral membrane protein MurJ [Pseudomonadota bacterium]
MNLLRSATTVGGYTMMSRVLGFVRELLIAALLGTGPVADAFYAAFRFPNLFRRLFAEGAFNSAFVPLFAKELEGGGKVQARAFASQVLSFLVVTLLTLTALAEIFMPFLVEWVIAPGFVDDPEKFDLTVLLTRVMFPYLMCMSLVAMLSGVLNSFGRFAAAAFAPVILNIVLISTLAGAWVFGLVSQTQIGTLMSWGVCASGVLQLILLCVAVERTDFSIGFVRPRLTPNVKRLLILAVPAAMAGGITQINLLIGQIIASQKAGAIATLQYADRIYQLPLGVVGIAIGVALLPDISRRLKAKDLDGVHNSQNRALELSMLLTVPAAVGLMALPIPVVQVLFERGQFTSDDTAATASALIAFAMGLPAFVMIKVFSPGFFAREDTRTPMIYAAISVVVNVGGSLLLFPHYAQTGIALATTAAGWVNAILLGATLAHRGHYRADRRLVRRLPWQLFGAVVMGAALMFAMTWGLLVFESDLNIFVRLAALIGLIGFGAGIYFAICHVSGAARLSELKASFKRA